MSQILITLEDIRTGCLEGDPTAWRSFVRLYGPLTRHLFKHYFRTGHLPVPGVGPHPHARWAQGWPDAFLAARANDAAFMRSFSDKGQKEFLLPWRRHVLGVGRAARGAPPDTPLTRESLEALLKPFPELQRGMLLLSLRGYTPAEAGVIAKSSAATVQKVLDAMRETPGGDVFSRNHDAVLAPLEDERGEECLSDHFFVHFEDGGTTTWRDRENAERHLKECLPCLARFTDYREAHYYFRSLPHLDEAVVNEVAARLGLPVERTGATRKPLWRRVWGK